METHLSFSLILTISQQHLQSLRYVVKYICDHRSTTQPLSLEQFRLRYHMWTYLQTESMFYFDRGALVSLFICILFMAVTFDFIYTLID